VYLKQLGEMKMSDSTGTVDSAGYGGTVDSAGYGGTVDPIVHFNQGIGNGAEGGDPGKSNPHGGSNDELGQMPGSNYGKKSTDVLIGSAGNDTLVGSWGADQFVYSTGQVFNKKDIGVDTITDFMTGTDKIVLSKTTFGSLKSMVGDGFSMGSDFSMVATDAGVDRASGAIVYSAESHSLFYNQNGSAGGLGSGAKFATLSNLAPGVVLSGSDFVVQA
jgi:RTX calcium-binding nonapeptide repeat (4 copies)